MEILTKMYQLTIDELPKSIDASQPFTIVTSIHNSSQVLNIVNNSNTYKMIVYIAEDGIGKSQLSNTKNTLFFAAENEQSALTYAKEAAAYSSTIYLVK